MNQYTEGDLVHVTCRITDPVTHELVSVASVTAQVKDPANTVTTPEPYVEGDRFAIDVDTTGIAPGQWYYRFTSPTPHQGAKESGFTVGASNFS